MSAPPAAGPTLAEVAAIRRAAEARRPKPILTAAEEQVLGRLLRHDDPAVAAEARAVLAERNQALVKSITNKWNAHDAGALDWEDLFQFGNEGLLKAIDAWEPERNLKFSTYATWWIEQRIRRALDDHRTAIRLPVHMSEALRKIARAKAALLVELGRPPTDAELAARANLSEQQLARAREGRRLAATSSLDAPTHPDSDREGYEVLGDTLANPADEALDLVAHEEDRRLVARLLASLPAKQARVLRLRHGLDGEGPRTLQAVADLVGLTRERVRQLEADALTTLRERVRPLMLATAAD